MDKDIQLTIGMDVGDTYAHLVVLDDHGAVVQRDRGTTKAASIRTWFGRRAKARVALEVGRHSPVASDRAVRRLNLPPPVRLPE